MKSKKKIRDVLEGRDYRAQITVFLNERVLNNEARVEFVHAYWRLLMPVELKKKNTFTNRVQPHSGRDNAVGLDCLLSASWTDVKIPLIIRRKADPDLYYKLPGDIEKDSFIHVYLNNAYFLLLDGKTDPARSRKYALVKGSQFRWWQSESKGNENRISAVKRNGRLIIPQRDLLWVDIFGEEYGFWRDELLDLRSALLNLLHGE